ncbi:hypothetical protein VFPFJ_09483 [Purpureocillium lilacinum]|uniref:Uncharacterized protein n=1 Tax=Purpureocillium lilacinum TaxID=33203 RepID=A0A179GU85_PURLI|nr:hypothetical protein VFPFJ_09483 [Purpureocillium lilacinum]OAQ81028.1 hypothetical protein VFPFJ_09483 [Purpureocillium lilacinum]
MTRDAQSGPRSVSSACPSPAFETWYHAPGLPGGHRGHEATNFASRRPATGMKIGNADCVITLLHSHAPMDNGTKPNAASEPEAKSCSSRCDSGSCRTRKGRSAAAGDVTFWRAGTIMRRPRLQHHT